jgi:predicted dienelactone hydrolase
MLNRNRDVSFAITELLVKNDASGELLQGVIDPSSIAASGHSLGGYTAYALAGGDDELCDALWATNYAGDSLPEPQFTCVPAPSDPRIRAVVSLDGSSQLLRYQELARISVPSLIMGETVEHVSGYNSMPADPNLGRFIARPHAAVNRSDSPRVDVTTANHVSFTNWCDELKIMSSLGVDTSGLPGNGAYPCVAQNTFDPANNPATRQIVTTYMLAFLNTQFGRADDAWMLTADYAAQNQPLVEFFDSEACDAPLPSTAYYTYRPHAGACQVAQQDPPDYFAP